MQSKFSTDEKPNAFEDITTYNNFYEFGTDKGDPAAHASALTIDPWSVKIDGMVEKPGDYDLADILAGVTLEERIYRFRCVEAWSMVVPWIGFPLGDLLARVNDGNEFRAGQFAQHTRVILSEVTYADDRNLHRRCGCHGFHRP